MAPSAHLQNFSFGVVLSFVLLTIIFPSCGGQNVPSIVNNAIQCFNDTAVYMKCQEQYVLTNNGLDGFCSSPCLAQTQLILGCIDGILSNFNFYSPATIEATDAAVLFFCDSLLRGAIPPIPTLPPVSTSPPTSATSPGPAPPPASSHGGSLSTPQILVPGLWAVGSLMFMALA